MEYVALGGTNLLVSHTSFGAMSLSELPSDEDAAQLVHKAYEGGINFFDTAHSTPESERRLGKVLRGMRHDVFLATKSDAKTADGLVKDLEESLEALQCTNVDLFQIENPEKVPLIGADDGLYAALASLKASGKVGHIGVVTESLEIASLVVDSGLYETLQMPFNVLCGKEALSIVERCNDKDIGFIAMQPLCGGVVSNIPIAYGFLNQFDNVIPVWGVRNGEELQQILYFTEHPPIIDDAFKLEAEKLRQFFN
ncbi:MAG: aldo/keto reductase [Treponema sp.]|nr:aldo/keto reductase [Treponema sp.]